MGFLQDTDCTAGRPACTVRVYSCSTKYGIIAQSKIPVEIKNLHHFRDNSVHEGFFISSAIFAIIPHGSILFESVSVIPVSMQFRYLLRASAFALLDRTDKKELLDAKVLL